MTTLSIDVVYRDGSKLRGGTFTASHVNPYAAWGKTWEAARIGLTIRNAADATIVSGRVS